LQSIFPAQPLPPPDDEPVFVSISFERGSVSFGAKAIRAIEAEGKMIKFYSDTTRRIIAWKLSPKVEMAPESNWRMFTINQTNKNALFSVNGIISELKLLLPPETKTIKAEIQKYIETTDLMNRGEEYYFVKLEADKEGDSIE